MPEKYDPSGLEILKLMPPVRGRGFTLTFDDDFPGLDLTASRCSALLAEDKGIRSVVVVTVEGKRMEIFRG